MNRKELLTRIGVKLSPELLDRLNSWLNHLCVGRWMDDMGFATPHRVERREQLFDIAGAQIADTPVLYLEFGVYRGESMRYWSALLRHPGAHLHGFDSFEGLPEDWTLSNPKGQFSTNGVCPSTDDSRVEFFKGWFEETLPKYVAPAHDVLVINIDCDVYSSALYVLRTLQTLMRPGTYIYFDEFYDRCHEMRAFAEFLRESNLCFELAGADKGLVRALFRCVG